MKCSRMHLNDRRYKPPPRVSKCESGPIVRQCSQRISLSECSQQIRSKSCRSSSSQTSHSEQNSSSSDSQKTPLIIVNLKIGSDVKTMAKNRSQEDNLNRKLPPFCINYQKQCQSTNSKGSNAPANFNAVADANMKVINDFIIQGTLIGNERRQRAATEGISPDIVIDCEDCNTTICDSTINVFNNINTDLLMSLDYYEMDSFGLGRLASDSTHPPTPIALSSSNRATSMSVLSQPPRTPTPTLLGVPTGFRPLSLRTPSPNTRTIIRVDLVNRDKQDSSLTKDIEYNLNRLKEKRGVRNRSEKSF